MATSSFELHLRHPTMHSVKTLTTVTASKTSCIGKCLYCSGDIHTGFGAHRGASLAVPIQHTFACDEFLTDQLHMLWASLKDVMAHDWAYSDTGRSSTGALAV